MLIDEICSPPHDWDAQVTELACRAGKSVSLHGNSEDCRESAGSIATVYRVVTGDIVAKQLPWLIRLYRSDIIPFIEETFGYPVFAANNDRYGVNINLLEGAGARYEWHVDPSPVSAVLFVTEHTAKDGGALALRDRDCTVKIIPRRGFIVLFEGGRVEHSVLPLERDILRVAVPMIYYTDPEKQPFSAELDNYLYGGSG